jgi:nucleotide-binding universal stress UspA family protein
LNAVDLTAELGAEPTLIRESGHAADRILETAAAQGASLITLGSRGLTGVRALGSVSERVAHRYFSAAAIGRTACAP